MYFLWNWLEFCGIGIERTVLPFCFPSVLLSRSTLVENILSLSRSTLPHRISSLVQASTSNLVSHSPSLPSSSTSSQEESVSISALDNVGYEFNFRNNKVGIFYDSEKIGECILTGGLYKLCTSLSNECLHVEKCSTKRSKTKDKSFVLWHKRLGHISRERVDRLIKDQILPPLDYSDIGACVDCAKEKLTKTGKKSATRMRSNRGGEYYGKYDEGGQQKGPFAKFLQDCEHSKGFRFYCPTHGTRIVEALTAKFLELDVAENSGSQPSETPESSISVSIPLTSLIEAFPSIIVREETVTLPALEEDPRMPVPKISQHHDLVPDNPQGHDPVPKITQVHEPDLREKEDLQSVLIIMFI
ncbi:Retrovirus-related Pol polyprotein from transposon TNT 1-94 [Senna tora]|uniref:Retrovirus-related Pol polyprotein from transposon TNT 1-94 n=1 Tax=Senna tora TaxID=362788 RepID=A0A834T2T2_9FABA|nr:Retrovirus-related Pol polyprotein from transposon TNT 1-94 [Senna tora]